MLLYMIAHKSKIVHYSQAEGLNTVFVQRLWPPVSSPYFYELHCQWAVNIMTRTGRKEKNTAFYFKFREFLVNAWTEIN